MEVVWILIGGIIEFCNKKLVKCESYSPTKGSVPVFSIFSVIAATIIHHP